jgi:hypothetical protein
MAVFLGVDPGNEGALAVLPDGPVPRITFHDTPLLIVKSGNKNRKVMNAPAVKLMLDAIIQEHGPDLYAVIEKVAAMPSTDDRKASMGATSAFNFGKGVGIWLGMLAMAGIPYEEVHPATWKSVLLRDMGKEKSASIMKATQLYPSTARDLTRVKDHGRADALMLAEYGRRVRNSVTTSRRVSTPRQSFTDELMEPSLF